MADLGLNFYEDEDEAIIEEEGDCLFKYSEIEEKTVITEDKSLPPLPPSNEFELDTFPTGIRYKYAEDLEFITLAELPALEKLFLCVSANAAPRRIWICTQIPKLLNELTLEQAFAYVFPLTLRLCQDDILAVRESLIESLDQILLFFYEIPFKNSEKLKMDEESMVQLLGVTLFSQESNLSEKSELAITSFLKLMDLNCFELELLPILINLLACNFKFDLNQYIDCSQNTIKIKVLKILTPLFSVFKLQTLIEVLLPTLENLIHETNYEIRKELAISLKSFFKLLKMDILIHRIYPLLESLCKDEVYEVRYETLDLLVEISETMIGIEGYSLKMINLFELLLKDNSNKVNNQANYLIGRFIYLFNNQNNITESLLKKYLSNCKSSKFELRLGSIVHFPAVLLSMGNKNWDKLVTYYQYLSKDKELQILTIFASSFHEIVKLLTNEQVNKDLLPIFERLINYNEDEIKFKIMINSIELYKKITEKEKERILKLIINLMNYYLTVDNDYIKDWRIKKQIIKQLSQFIPLLKNQFTVLQLLPMLLNNASLKQPKEIRYWIVELIPSIYEKVHLNLENESSLWVYFFDLLNDLLHSKSYYNRQLYILICEKIQQVYFDQSIFEQFFLPNLARLVNDKTFEVRYLLVKFLCKLKLEDVNLRKKDFNGNEKKEEIENKERKTEAEEKINGSKQNDLEDGINENKQNELREDKNENEQVNLDDESKQINSNDKEIILKVNDKDSNIRMDLLNELLSRYDKEDSNLIKSIIHQLDQLKLE
ncbi:ARM repeat-containing protein [Neoconidiobolus thromboides FSU 785]|nr:ARM repeat-containing protein [Neoconidiobolus thromboides FSU 785]